jgi:hypothetical protein
MKLSTQLTAAFTLSTLCYSSAFTNHVGTLASHNVWIAGRISTPPHRAKLFASSSQHESKGEDEAQRLGSSETLTEQNALSSEDSEEESFEIKSSQVQVQDAGEEMATKSLPPTTSTQELKRSSLDRLRGSKVLSVKTNEMIELSNFLKSGTEKSMLILGTYAADFNAIEYVQRLRFYLPELIKRGVNKIGLVLNCDTQAATKLVEILDLKTDATSDDAVIELFVDPTGEAGRAFGVGRGWKPDDDEMSPYLKLFGMLWGLGAWATLPAVIGGYIGNPFYAQPWIEDALAVGQRKGRWPDNALELDDESGQVKVNKFKELPYVGGWERRPLELATLRLQNMVDISIKNWKELAPSQEALKAGVLTQLGGAVVIDCETEKELFRWRDPGICAVANFEDILKEISANDKE